jgi:hypothetical protein
VAHEGGGGHLRASRASQAVANLLHGGKHAGDNGFSVMRGAGRVSFRTVYAGRFGPNAFHDAFIRIAQLNFVVGDLPGNAQKIIDAATQAYADGARCC